MPTIHNPVLTVAPHEDLTRATVRMVCNVEFTDFEVNAMNQLGLRYALSCEILNKDLWYETTSLAFDDVAFPRLPRRATASEEVVFERIAPLDELREHVFTKDELLAELTLVNGETGEQQVVRTARVKVDLAV